MARFKVRPVDWEGNPVGYAVVVEATDRHKAEAKAFRLPKFPEGPTHTAPIGDTDARTLPCGCQRHGLTRVRNGVTYTVEREPRKVRGLWRCQGCDTPQHGGSR